MRSLVQVKLRAAARRLLVASALVLLPAGAGAQDCFRPSGVKPNWGALGTGLAEGSHGAVTLEAGRNFTPDLAVFAEVDGVVWNGGELLPTRRSLRVTGAYRFQAATKESDTLLDAVALCATAAPEYVRNGDLNVVHAPLGLVVSTEWQSADGKWRVVPHVEPQLGLRFAELEGFWQTSGAIALRLGVTGGIDRYFGGISFHRPLTSGDAWTARLRMGVEF
jgi:hypothetical protein